MCSLGSKIKSGLSPLGSWFGNVGGNILYSILTPAIITLTVLILIFLCFKVFMCSFSFFSKQIQQKRSERVREDFTMQMCVLRYSKVHEGNESPRGFSERDGD